MIKRLQDRNVVFVLLKVLLQQCPSISINIGYVSISLYYPQRHDCNTAKDMNVLFTEKYQDHLIVAILSETVSIVLRNLDSAFWREPIDVRVFIHFQGSVSCFIITGNNDTAQLSLPFLI